MRTVTAYEDDHGVLHHTEEAAKQANKEAALRELVEELIDDCCYPGFSRQGTTSRVLEFIKGHAKELKECL